MSLIDIVKHARPMKLKDGKRHVWPTLASMVYLADGTTPLADADGNLNADNSEKFGGRPPEYYRNPRNLLDNSDFRNPVNQRGQNSFVAGTSTSFIYSFDRWLCRTREKIATLNANGFSIELTEATSGSVGIIQTHEAKNLAGKTVTLAAKFTSVAHKAYLAINDQTSSSQWGTGIRSFTSTVIGAPGVYTLTATIPNTLSGELIGFFVGDVGATAGTMSVEWAAVYEGEYTAETLPPYIPKGYAAEMVACQQYLFPITGSPAHNLRLVGWYRAWNSDSDIRLSVQTPIPMPWDNPNLLIVGDVSSITMEFSGVSRAPSSVQVLKRLGNFVMLKFYMNNVPTSGSHPAVVSIPETVKLFISCEP